MRHRTFTNLEPLFLVIFSICFCALLTVAQTRTNRRRLPTKPTAVAASYKKRAAEIAEHYWSSRFTRCGDALLWAVRRSGPETGTTSGGRLIFFQGKGSPVLTIEGGHTPPKSPIEGQRQNGDDPQPVEWSGRSRVSIKLGQTLSCEGCPRDDTWRNLSYSIGIRSVKGIWETFEDNAVIERVVSEPLFESIVSSPSLVFSGCLGHGGNSNAVNECGETLLMTAVALGRANAVAELLFHHVDINLKNRNGWTASYLARLRNYQDVAELLDRAGAICEGPEKDVCKKFPRKDSSKFATLAPDPMLMAERDSRRRSDPPGFQKPRILSKPEAEYTDEARKNQVVGTVVLRLLFLPSGKVTNIRVVSGLPYGLSERAVEAAKKIKFTPAMIDGRPVERDMQVEYNFNLY